MADLNYELERLRLENDYLRGIVQHNPEWRCVYGHDVPNMSHCPSGFPGCACADDLMCGEEEVFRSVVAERNALRQELDGVLKMIGPDRVDEIG